MAREFQTQVHDAVRDEAALRTALADADIAPQLMVLVQLTGDLAILDEVAPHIHGAWSFLESVPPALRQKIQDRLVEVLQDYAVLDRPAPPLPPAETLGTIPLFLKRICLHPFRSEAISSQRS